MSQIKDLTGQRIGRVTVLSRAENDSRGRVRWNYQCDCGTKSIARGDNLRRTQTRGCQSCKRGIRAKSDTSRHVCTSDLMVSAMRHMNLTKKALKEIERRYPHKNQDGIEDWYLMIMWEDEEMPYKEIREFVNWLESDDEPQQP